MIPHGLIGVTAAHFGVEQVRVLSGGVVTPNGHFRDLGDRDAETLRKLALGTVVVEASHRRESTRVKIRGVTHRNQRVGVSRVTHHEHFDITLSGPGQSLTLGLEDSTIGREKVAALHTGLTRHCTHQERHIGITKCPVGIIGAHHFAQEREGAVVELHAHTFKGTERRSNLQQLQGNRSVRPEHRSRSDSEQQGVTDLAGSSGYGNAHW